MIKFPSLPTTSEWVEQTLARLTLDQKIGQLLHPCLWPSASEDERIKALEGIEPGGVFLLPGKKDDFTAVTDWLQERSLVPLVISADLENGAGRVVEGATSFPKIMSLAATDDETFAFEMGRAAAVEGRACGIHWSFGPFVDINANPHNPGTNTSSLGDDPDRIARLSTTMIRGMQENGLCATAKHFPGGGFDDRDQHICNTINPLRMDQWFALSGRMFQEAIDLGVWSIMVGHISLPAWDPGDGSHIQTSPPATLSRRIVSDLLRERMGFQGVIVTDAMNMGGVTSWGPFEEIIPGTIAAGCDMILFSSAKRDFDILRRAVESGRLTEARIEESVRRILALKEMLGLHENLDPLSVTAADSEHFQHISREIAEKALTLVRDRNGALPLKLEQGTRVFSYHLRGDPESNVDAFDELLRERGAEVTRLSETDLGRLPETGDLASFDIVLMSAVFGTSWGTNRIRPAGNYMRDVWSLITSHHPRLVFVSYGSPYHIYDMPHLPLVINAYSPDLNTQNAVLRLLTGEIEATGKSPVDLEGPYRFKSLEGLRYQAAGSGC
jgi:beta-N-acetylhexosaminidase